MKHSYTERVKQYCHVHINAVEAYVLHMQYFFCQVSFIPYYTTNKLRRRTYVYITAVSFSYFGAFYVKYFIHKYFCGVWVQNVKLI